MLQDKENNQPASANELVRLNLIASILILILLISVDQNEGFQKAAEAFHHVYPHAILQRLQTLVSETGVNVLPPEIQKELQLYFNESSLKPTVPDVHPATLLQQVVGEPEFVEPDAKIDQLPTKGKASVRFFPDQEFFEVDVLDIHYIDGKPAFFDFITSSGTFDSLPATDDLPEDLRLIEWFRNEE